VKKALKGTNLSLNVGQAQGATGYRIMTADKEHFEVEVRAVLLDVVNQHFKAYTYVEALTVRCEGNPLKCAIVEFKKASGTRDVVEGEIKI
jgi:hypothetical protein